MKMLNKKKKTLWSRIDTKLGKWGNYLMFNPQALIYVSYIGLSFLFLVFAGLAFLFYTLARNGASGYYFGMAIMLGLDLFVIYGFTKIKEFKNLFGGMGTDDLNDMVFGSMVNPIIDKIKYGKKK